MTEIITTDLVPLRLRGKWFGIIAMMWAIGSVSGPIIGGGFAQNVTWVRAMLSQSARCRPADTRAEVDFLGQSTPERGSCRPGRCFPQARLQGRQSRRAASARGLGWILLLRRCHDKLLDPRDVGASFLGAIGVCKLRGCAGWWPVCLGLVEDLGPPDHRRRGACRIRSVREIHGY